MSKKFSTYKDKDPNKKLIIKKIIQNKGFTDKDKDPNKKLIINKIIQNRDSTEAILFVYVIVISTFLVFYYNS